ncbi:uncharacterized protein LOC143589081 [Bidens hawaiensis]|uniref:uncharacterized protein LOC143589081 n=1 Tax=Bidens hawaiensis TaxID=980011 RepID=UPI004049FD5B
MAYLSSGILLEEKAVAWKIIQKALNYQMQDEVLYRRYFLGPLLRCGDVVDANYLIREVHEGICGLHAGSIMVIAKLMNAGELQEWLKELQVTQIFTYVAHPQANGQVKRTNRTIKEGIDELPHVLWAFRTQKNSSNSETPFSLTYGTEAMTSAEIGVPSARILMINDSDKELRMNLYLLEERRELALIREHNCKCQLQKYYDSRVQKCTFDAEDFVFRNIEASGQEPPGKLGPTWEGPYKVKGVLSKGAYKLEMLDGTKIPRTWNMAQFKECYI